MTLPEYALYRLAAPGLRLRSFPESAPLADTDAVIFDIDGVLVDVKGSFREVISLSVQHYFNRVLMVPGETRLVSADETAQFKLAGRFNNDWDLAQGAVAWGLLKLVRSGDGTGSTNSLRKGSPSLVDFTGRVREQGGGLDSTLHLVGQNLDKPQKATFDRLYHPELVKRIFQEYYAGPRLCRLFYGFDPEHYSGPGLVEKERVILDLTLVKRLHGLGVAFGVLSGRTVEEADYVLAQLGLERFIHPGGKVVDDGALEPKPDPAGLVHLAQGMGFSRAVYVGDVPDDWTTVAAYRKAAPGAAVISGCMVATGADPGGELSRHFESAGVDFLSQDVNALLNAILDLKSGGC